MTPRLRKLGLVAHITSSVGWLGAVAGFLALNIAGLTSPDPAVVCSAYLAMNLIGRFVIVPLSLAALTTGIVQAAGTEWGLFRHFWVLAKLLLTIFSAIILIAKIPLMDRAARLAAEMAWPNADLRVAGMQLLVHSAGGLLVLLVITALSVYKPWGQTFYGRRESTSSLRPPPLSIAERHQSPQVPRETTGTIPPAGPDPDNKTVTASRPSGLKIFLAVVGVVVCAFILLHLSGGAHGSHGH